MSNDYSARNPRLASLYPDHLRTIMSRFDHALEKAGAAHAVVFSGSPHLAFLDDNSYPFRANPHFLSWLPLTDVPSSYVSYSPGEQPVLFYHQPKDYWNPVPAAPDGYWTQQFDIRVVHTLDEVSKRLPAHAETSIFIGEIGDEAHALGIERINPASVLNCLHLARGVKTDYELECLRLASRRGVAGHRAAESAFRNGESEFGIQQAYCRAVQLSDNELPYTNIIAINEHGAVLHYTNLEHDPPHEHRSLLIDAGAQVHGYATDITRTYSNGDARFADLIERMNELQLAVAGEVRAGVDYRDIHLGTHRKIGELLVDTELARGDPAELLALGVTSAFFPHGVGHLLGIQVHDVGGFMQDEMGTHIDPPSGHPFLRLTRVLEADMVVTIEPGIYAIDLLLENLRGTRAEKRVNWDTVDWFRPFGGIRIEDDVRVLANGCENLTRNAFDAGAC